MSLYTPIYRWPVFSQTIKWINTQFCGNAIFHIPTPQFFAFQKFSMYCSDLFLVFVLTWSLWGWKCLTATAPTVLKTVEWNFCECLPMASFTHVIWLICQMYEILTFTKIIENFENSQHGTIMARNFRNVTLSTVMTHYQRLPLIGQRFFIGKLLKVHSRKKERKGQRIVTSCNIWNFRFKKRLKFNIVVAKWNIANILEMANHRVNWMKLGLRVTVCVGGRGLLVTHILVTFGITVH